MSPQDYKPGPFRVAAGGLQVALRVTPGARKEAIEGLAETAEGGVALKVKVTVAPEGGRANAAVVALLAKAWGLPKSSLTIVQGETGRQKRLAVAGDPEALLPVLQAWLAGLRESG